MYRWTNSSGGGQKWYLHCFVCCFFNGFWIWNAFEMDLWKLKNKLLADNMTRHKQTDRQTDGHPETYDSIFLGTSKQFWNIHSFHMFLLGMTKGLLFFFLFIQIWFDLNDVPLTNNVDCLWVSAWPRPFVRTDRLTAGCYLDTISLSTLVCKSNIIQIFWKQVYISMIFSFFSCFLKKGNYHLKRGGFDSFITFD